MAQDLLRLEHQLKNHQKTDWFEVLPAEVGSDADRTSGLFVNRYAKAIMFAVILSNEENTAGFTPKLLVPNPVSGGDDITLVTFTEITAAATAILTVSPYTLTGFGTEFKLGMVPREWKFMLDYTTGSAGTDKFDTQVFARYL